MTRSAYLRTAAAAAILLPLAGCGQSDTKQASDRPPALRGTCAADTGAYPSLRPLSARLANDALGPGRVKVNGTIRTDDERVPDSGSCTYFLAASPTEHQLMLAVNQKTDFFASADEARNVASTDPNAKPIDGVDGFSIDKTKSYEDGTRGQLSYAVGFTASGTLIWVSVLTPEKAGSTSHADDAVAALKASLEALTRPV